jgi:hypothetical protein
VRYSQPSSFAGCHFEIISRYSQVFRIAAILATLAFSVNISAQTAVKIPVPLTHADQVRQLTPEQAAMGYPVTVRGVITMDAPAPDFFVQDKTAGIFVEGSAT